MIEFIKGTLEEMEADSIVVVNHEIAYKIYASAQIVNQLPKIGSMVKIYIHMNVKEDDISLYGFFTKQERNLYRKLISVSGVGPKAAMGLLSVHTSNDIIWAIVAEDIKALTKGPGVGKKMAQRIILELKDKLNLQESQFTENLGKTSNKVNIKDEAANALIALGYQSSQAHKVIASIYKEDVDVETLIKEALKALASK